ncbi:N-acetylmuramoyl-L-alanine amidase [bacterium]|nr:N-acetylmuramoyl-L-alanine amidase [bacterium]
MNSVFFAILILCISFVFTINCVASPVLSRYSEIKKIRFWTAPDHIRIVLDMSGESIYRVRELTNPYRIVIDIPGGKFSSGLKGTEINNGVIDRIRINRLRSSAQVVFDLPRKTHFDHFALKPFKSHPYRIVFDLKKSFSEEEIKRKINTAKLIATSGDRIVIIDPGHGGSDPGACSGSGIKEKDVVLQICRMFAESINKTKGYKAILTRRGDYNVALGKRIEIARSHGGDCFVSVHLNSYPHSRACGSEIYFLSLDGSTDKNAQRVAERENFLLELWNKDKVREDDVQSILLDLTKNDVMSKSSVLAECVAAKMGKTNSIPFRGVKQANFVVLRSMAMPSILVEAAFLSNPRDVRLLRKRDVLNTIAREIAEGVISFLESNSIAETYMGKINYIEHIVKKGETLWSISREYGLPVGSIRSLNNLGKGSTIHPGQKLRLSGKE